MSNPPYVAVGDPELEESVRTWEPESALLAGSDGLDDLRAIIHGAPQWLAPGGLLVVETGHTQGGDVRALASSAGLVDASVQKDPAGRDRFVAARR